jgi:hypothetical protein
MAFIWKIINAKDTLSMDASLKATQNAWPAETDTYYQTMPAEK